MKISYLWLKEWVNCHLSSAEVAEQLTLAGLEVDHCLPVADDFTDVIIAQVKEVAPHPQAEKLTICQIDTGQGELHTVVCGAPNVSVGIKTPYAQIGAILRQQTAQPKVMQAASLRGVMSAGMLCSAADLGLAESSEGLLVLPSDAPLGKDIREYLQLDDTILDIQLTPNRGDCLSLLGIAREVGALNRIARATLESLPTPAGLITIPPVAPTHSERFPIHIQAEQACLRYSSRIIKNIDNTITSPIWMQERLRRSGIRSISLIVDVMNYVMLEVGQPLHAFDFQKLTQEIIVRYAQAGETLTLLDNQTVLLKPTTLIIADTQGPLALAGVMGGLASAVAKETTDIFIESAFFTPEAVQGQARGYGLQTDGAYRFERGVDPLLPSIALERASALLIAIGGGSAGPIEEVMTKKTLVEEKQITLTVAHLERLLGTVLLHSEIADILQRLGMQVENIPTGWKITVPSYRFDMALPEDVIEEIARVYGYTRLPVTLPQFSMALPPPQQLRLTAEKFAQVLVARGYQEVITYSFIDPVLEKLCNPTLTPITLLNPIASDMSVMRTSLWPGLLSTLQYNLNRQQERVSCFEHGLCFIPTGEQQELLQQPRLAGIVTGSVFSEKWHTAAFNHDFYTIKADIMALLALTHASELFQLVPGQHDALHPGQTAVIQTDAGDIIGYIGAFHPQLLQTLDIKNAVYGFELILSKINRAKLPHYQSISAFPSVRRDLAFTLQQSVLALHVRQAAQEVSGPWLVDVTIFDVYQGTGIAEGYKSIALSLTLQHPERTLTDTEVDEIMQRVIAALQRQFAAELRK